MRIPYTKGGERLQGTLEIVEGVALVDGVDEHGDLVYDGETKMYWDTQKTVVRRKHRIWVSEDGGEYPESQVVFREESEEAVGATT